MKKTKKATTARRRKAPIKKLTIADLKKVVGGYVAPDDGGNKADVEAYGGRRSTVEW